MKLYLRSGKTEVDYGIGGAAGEALASFAAQLAAAVIDATISASDMLEADRAAMAKAEAARKADPNAERDAQEIRQQLARAAVLSLKPTSIAVEDDDGNEIVLAQTDGDKGLAHFAAACRLSTAMLIGSLRTGTAGLALTEDGATFLGMLEGFSDAALAEASESDEGLKLYSKADFDAAVRAEVDAREKAAEAAKVPLIDPIAPTKGKGRSKAAPAEREDEAPAFGALDDDDDEADALDALLGPGPKAPEKEPVPPARVKAGKR